MEEMKICIGLRVQTIKGPGTIISVKDKFVTVELDDGHGIYDFSIYSIFNITPRDIPNNQNYDANIAIINYLESLIPEPINGLATYPIITPEFIEDLRKKFCK